MVSSLTVMTALAMKLLESQSESSQSQEDMQTLSSSVHVWPSDTDIQFVPGTTCVLLTIQGTLLKTVLKTFRKTPSVMFGLHTSRSYVGLPLSFPLLPHPRSPVRYGSGVNLLYDMDLVLTSCTIRIGCQFLRDTILWSKSVRYQSQSHYYYNT